MGLFGVATEVMKPTALVLNILVATVGAARFATSRVVPWRSVRWLCLGSLPAAFLGGTLQLPVKTYLAFVGLTLMFAAARLWMTGASRVASEPARAWWLVGIGADLGFVSGLTGIGGGIFLTPILLLSGWEEPRRTGGAAAVFILMNSVLGLLGHLSSTRMVPSEASILGAFAVAGGLIGSWMGAHRLDPATLRRVHAVVLVVSGTKLLVDGWR